MELVHLPPRPVASSAPTSRRALIARTARAVGVAVVAASVPGSLWVEFAAAQDRTVTLKTATAEISASPGSAVARTAVAEAAAARGAARVRAAAALASAESGGGAMTQGFAASAAADPAQGAVAQGAIAAATASNQPDDQDAAQRPAMMVRRVPASRGAGGQARAPRIRGAPAGGGRQRRAGGRARAGRGGRERVGRAPRTGVGNEAMSRMPALFAVASGAAGLVALMLRQESLSGRLAKSLAVIRPD